jgi:diacylglycerol kinase family enzyme
MPSSKPSSSPSPSFPLDERLLLRDTSFRLVVARGGAAPGGSAGAGASSGAGASAGGDAPVPAVLTLYPDRLEYILAGGETSPSPSRPTVLLADDLLCARAGYGGAPRSSLTVLAYPHPSPAAGLCGGRPSAGAVESARSQRSRVALHFLRDPRADVAASPLLPVGATAEDGGDALTSSAGVTSASQRAADIVALWAACIGRVATGLPRPGPGAGGGPLHTAHLLKLFGLDDGEVSAAVAGAGKSSRPHAPPSTSATATSPSGLLTGLYAHPSPLPAPLDPPSGLPPRRRLLVYVMPTSGPGQAVRVWRTECAGVVADGGCTVDEVVTTHAGHCTQEIRDMPWERLAGYDGVVAVGGDGSLAEVVRGLMSRPDWARVVERVAVGVIPAGSGNGLALSLLHRADRPPSVANAAMLIAKGHISRLDMASVFSLGEAGADPLHRKGSGSGSSSGAPTPHPPDSSSSATLNPAIVSPVRTGSKLEASSSSSASTEAGAGARGVRAKDEGGVEEEEGEDEPASLPSHPLSAPHKNHGKWGARTFTFLSLEWGIVADIDIESESLRFLGGARFDVYGLIRGLFLRRYRGTFAYLPAHATHVGGGEEAAAAVKRAAGRAVSPPADASTPAPVGDKADHSSTRDRTASSSSSSTAASHGPPLAHLVPFDRPVPLNWRSLSGTFTFLWITQTSHQSGGVALVPGARLDDGLFTVTIVRDTSPLGMLNVLLALDDKGSQANCTGVETFTCSAWRLEPEHRGAPRRAGEAAPVHNHRASGVGHVTLDGEDSPYGPVQAEMHRGLLRVYGPQGGDGGGVGEAV